MDKKLKVLVYSDLVVKTGFSRVSHSIFGNLTNKLDITGLGINYRGDPIPIDSKYFPVYPASIGGDLYGLNRLKEFVPQKPDIIFILNDAWVTDKVLKSIKDAWVGVQFPKIVCYVPVDAEEHDPLWYQNFDIVSAVVAYTQFGKDIILKTAPQLKDRLSIIPHGTDTETFFPISRSEARKHLFRKDNDLFIFLNCGRNQPRKKLDITMEAFKLFSEGKDDVRLYLHAGVVDMSMNIAKLSMRLRIDNKLILSNQYQGPQQVSDNTLNLIYNASDIGLNSGLGEGFGLPNVEHASTGAPQIVPDSSACRELFSDCGVLVPANIRWTFDNIMTVGKMITPEDMAKAMELVYTDRELCSKLSQASIEKFTRPEYNWKNISEVWYNLFEEVYHNESVTLGE